jgi:hypothetical protein
MDGGSTRTGVVLETDREIVDYYSGRDIAFKSVGKSKLYGSELLVAPERSWYMYALEFPYSDILTADGTWNFGDRNVTVQRGTDEVQVTIDHPDHVGEIVFTFDLEFDGYLTRVWHTSSNGMRYKSEITWTRNPQRLVYPKSIRKYRAATGEDTPFYQVDFESFSRISPGSVASSFFTEAGIGISETTRLTIYRKGRPPIIRGRKNDQPKDLKSLGESLRGKGFSKDN